MKQRPWKFFPPLPLLTPREQQRFDAFRSARNITITKALLLGALIYETIVLGIGYLTASHSAGRSLLSLGGVVFLFSVVVLSVTRASRWTVEQQHWVLRVLSGAWLLYCVVADYLIGSVFPGGDTQNMFTFSALVFSIVLLFHWKELLGLFLPSLLLLLFLQLYREGDFQPGNYLVALLVIGVSNRFMYAHHLHGFRNRLIIEEQRQQLRALDRRKTAFLADISHEFRTPLSLLSYQITELREGKFPANPTGVLRRMQRQVDRTLLLVDQLLALASLKTGNLTVNEEATDLANLLRSAADHFAHIAEAREIGWRVRLPDHPVSCRIDAEKLETVLLNVIGNACKFTPPGGSVSLELAARPPDRLVITVTDTGIGIPEDQLPLVFERFYRVEPPGQNRYAGTGIGLALAKSLVEMQGGRIELTSAVDQGTSVIISLRRTWHAGPVATPTEALRGEPSRHGPARRPAAGRALLLLVEDHAEQRRYLADRLSRRFRVLTTATATAGLEAATRQLPDLIVSDVTLAGTDGFALCRAVKSDPLTAHIPVVLLTARAARADKLAGLETGADDYLVKPVDLAELEIRLQNLLDQRRRLREKFHAREQLPPGRVAVNSADDRFHRSLLEVAEKSLADDRFGVRELAKALHISSSQLHRKISAVADQSPSAFLRTMRLKRADRLLREKAGTVSEIAFRCGFASLAYFSRMYKREFGVPPSQAMGEN